MVYIPEESTGLIPKCWSQTDQTLKIQPVGDENDGPWQEREKSAVGI